MNPSPSTLRLDDFRRDEDDGVVESARACDLVESSSSVRRLSNLVDSSVPLFDLPELDLGMLADACLKIASRT